MMRAFKSGLTVKVDNQSVLVMARDEIFTVVKRLTAEEVDELIRDLAAARVEINKSKPTSKGE